MAPSLARARRLGFAALLLVGSGGASAHAQSGRGAPPETTLSETPEVTGPEADREARTLFEQGRRAYDEGRYRDAWDYFRQAYLLSKRPALLYNVGQAADRLRKDREALEAFRMYLAQVPNAENRREVENRVRALEEQVAAAPAMQTAPPPGSPDPTYADPAYATTPAPETTATEPAGTLGGDSSTAAPPQSSDEQPVRTGWYARLAAGFGVLGDSVGGTGTDDVSLTTLTLVGHLGVGHDVIEGLVVAGGVDFLWGLTPKVHVGDSSLDAGTANLTLVLAFADYYFAPQKHGWHVGGGFGLAFFSLSENNAVIGVENPGGGAIVVAGGHDWTLSRKWAAGLLGRLTFAQVGNDTSDHSIFAFSVLGDVNWF